MTSVSRRSFLKLGAAAVILCGLGFILKEELGKLFNPENPPASDLHEALYYEKLVGKTLECHLCSHNCTVVEGERGFCRSRENIRGKYYSLVYGNPVAIHIDPIEKLPMKHVFPGTDTLCVGTACCNFRCLYCINWNIAVQTPEDVESFPKSPEEIVQMAIDHDLSMICFTFNEATIAYEYMIDVFKLAKAKGIRTAFHTNGFMQPKPARALLPYLDAVVVDLKAFSNELYSELAHGELQPVLDFLMLVQAEGAWLEVVNLIVPTYNDDLSDIEKLCAWIRDNLGSEVPLHFSRFFPTYKLEKLPPTPIDVLEDAIEVGRKTGLKYLYIGNVPGHKFTDTYCPQCGKNIIDRKEYIIIENNIKEGKCRFCGYKIPGLWEA